MRHLPDTIARLPADLANPRGARLDPRTDARGGPLRGACASTRARTPDPYNAGRVGGVLYRIPWEPKAYGIASDPLYSKIKARLRIFTIMAPIHSDRENISREDPARARFANTTVMEKPEHSLAFLDVFPQAPVHCVLDVV